MSTSDKALAKALLATTSPLFEQQFRRLAGNQLDLETSSTLDPEKMLRPDLDIFFVQEDMTDGGRLEALIEAVRASGAKTGLGTPPIIAFSREPQASVRALARGASGFLGLPCRSEEFWSLVRTWLKMHRRGRVGSDAGTAVAAAPITSPHRKPATILLVDDSSVIHAFVQQALQGLGYVLHHANDGLEGLAAARKAVPDLVISDIDMPNMDGYEMCRRLRAEPATQTVPILLLSARGKGVDVDRNFDAGVNDFLSKPVTETELQWRIEQVLSSTRLKEHWRERILVVDDNVVHRSVMVQALAWQGFRLESAANGREALHLAEHTPPDLVITNSELPIMSGYDLTHELKTRPRFQDVPIVMLTALDSALGRLKSKPLGVASYLAKPFAPEKMVVIAERLIAERRLLRERNAKAPLPLNGG